VDDDEDSVLEGSNVTLICRIFSEAEFSSPPEWSYRINNTGPPQILNELDPHERKFSIKNLSNKIPF
jgi:hypothetical protein